MTTENKSQQLTYRDAGVDIDAGNLSVSGARKDRDTADSGYPC